MPDTTIITRLPNSSLWPPDFPSLAGGTIQFMPPESFIGGMYKFAQPLIPGMTLGDFEFFFDAWFPYFVLENPNFVLIGPERFQAMLITQGLGPYIHLPSGARPPFREWVGDAYPEIPGAGPGGIYLEGGASGPPRPGLTTIPQSMGSTISVPERRPPTGLVVGTSAGAVPSPTGRVPPDIALPPPIARPNAPSLTSLPTQGRPVGLYSGGVLIATTGDPAVAGVWPTLGPGYQVGPPDSAPPFASAPIAPVSRPSMVPEVNPDRLVIPSPFRDPSIPLEQAPPGRRPLTADELAVIEPLEQFPVRRPTIVEPPVTPTGRPTTGRPPRPGRWPRLSYVLPFGPNPGRNEFGGVDWISEPVRTVLESNPITNPNIAIDFLVARPLAAILQPGLSSPPMVTRPTGPPIPEWAYLPEWLHAPVRSPASPQVGGMVNPGTTTVGGGGVAPPPTILTSCCVNGINTTLTVVTSGKTGTCSCLPASFNISYNGSVWISATPLGTCGASLFNLRCIGGTGPQDFRLEAESCVTGPTAPNSWSCSPFQLVFSNVLLQSISGVTCCDGRCSFTITEAA